MIDEDLPVREDVVPKRRGALRFDGLRLDGFKSFPDRTLLPIEPGLTGVVGPNGCGKSNLLECLRWVLGETSAKRMRGGAMDDVIFAGTERRPARNVCEGVIVLDNRLRTAPPEFNDSDSLEIVRRLQRGEGTSYRVNGKPARLRDIQILFQDNASGAGSSAIVSQGRVGALINAKASERRGVLEEAAGVSGLSARRHDFELKLRQTEQNLQRAEDSLAEVNTQAAVLRRQARALQRWREFDERIRTTAAQMLLARLISGRKNLQDAEKAHADNETAVATAMLAANEATRRREQIAETLPPQREKRTQADVEAARAAARLEGIENEAERTARELFEVQQRNLELTADRAREDQSIQEAQRSLTTRQEEQAELAEIRAGEAEALEMQSDAVDTARVEVEAADATVNRLSTDLATREASRIAAQRQREEAHRRVQAVEGRLTDADAKLRGAMSALPDQEKVEALAENLASLEERHFTLGDDVAAVEILLERLRTDSDAASETVRELASETARLEAEAAGLGAVAMSDMSADPVSATLRIAAGYEKAVAAAFDESLQAGLNSSDLQWWRDGAIAAPRDGTLAEFVSGVPEVVAAAAYVLVFETEGEAAAAFPLTAGMTAVSKDGFFARWDGLSGRRAGDRVESALRRAARLREVEARLAEIAPLLAESRISLERASAATAEARRRETDGKAELRSLADRLRQAREAYTKFSAAGEEARRAVAVAEAEVSSIRAERQSLLQDLRAAGDALSEIPEDADAAQTLQEARRKLAAVRETESNARVAMERLTNEQNARRTRADTLMREILEWSRRLEAAKERRADLSRRYTELEKAVADLEARRATPAEILAEAREVFENAKAAAAEAARLLEEAERARDQAEEDGRRADASLATLREDRARILGVLAQAQQQIAAVEASCLERLSVSVDDLPSLAKLEDGQRLPDPNVLEAQLIRLERERENFGPVNFLAEKELEEHDSRLAEMEKSREEIKEAVVKLRQGIKEIEEEARGKLEEAFRRIDRSFGELFVRLFEGGQAHLRLVGEDILEAGLEIYASPPGKRMQILSLLSGGEQTLTAMALIFAAFLSNPSPICVLDEADAALDDSNTDRLIRLVESMALNDATRFLVVTHNPLTMARMNRIFGVTMQEQGVSILTKVDLDQAMEIRET